MRVLVSVVFALGVALASAAPAYAIIIPIESGSCTALSGCITEDPAPSPWDDVSLSWVITQDTDTLLYTYEYTFSDPGDGSSAQNKSLSHIIIQISEGNTTVSGGSGCPDGAIATYSGADPSNPGMPGPLYAIKCSTFPDGDQTTPPFTWTFSLISDQGPVYGDFFVIDGKPPGNEVYAYNTGFLTEPDSSDPLNHIRVPDGEDIVAAEPASLLLLGVGLTTAAVTARRRRRVR